ncbi:recombination associated protein RdgC [Natronocella acetinitrilica]|uniref:Recombination-associated protein RdgC n=1 Tax=Natronocella acetinitrilica TaxID=414046 RepID=A0AAE3KAE3_9GAMM|nr:recombination-associated protein RdgC [Natronocella acetinitrilica]MCP1674180.1 recombination associated protein RdgC [Natronocella acetinitrilica]
MSWLKNLSVYQFDGAGVSADVLAEGLAEHPFAPCAPTEAERSGWVAPLGGEGQLVHELQAAMLFSLQTEKKVVPAGVIRERMNELVREIQEQQPGRKIDKSLKEDLQQRILDELLPRAFPQISRMRGYIDTRLGLLLVETTSANKADAFVEQLRGALRKTEHNLSFVRFNHEPREIISNWMRNNDLPEAFEAGMKCVLKDGDGTGSINYKGQELNNDEQLRQYLADYKYISELELSHQDNVTFTLTEKMVLKGIKPIGLVSDNIKAIDHDDEISRQDAEFALHIGAVRELFPALALAFGGEVRNQAAGD